MQDKKEADEREKKRQEEIEEAQKKAAKQALKDAEEKRIRDEERAKRKEAMKPDKEKLLAYAALIDELISKAPKIEDAGISLMLQATLRALCELSIDIKDQLKKI